MFLMVCLSSQKTDRWEEKAFESSLSNWQREQQDSQQVKTPREPLDMQPELTADPGSSGKSIILKEQITNYIHNNNKKWDKNARKEGYFHNVIIMPSSYQAVI